MISIVMPVYNTPVDWLEQSVLSCLNQTLQNFELVIVDNDSTLKETKNFYKRIKNIDKIKIYNSFKQKGKRGVSTSINIGIKNSKYDFIARMDSDDWMYPERLEKQFNFLNTNKDVDVLGTQMKIVQTGFITRHPGVLTKENILNYDTGWFINHPTVMFRKSLFEKIGLYAEEPEVFPEDYEMWSRCLAQNIKICNLQDCLLNYNQHGQNASTVHATKKEWTENLNNFKNRFL